ncbi:MAG: glycogen debranching protein GlgX [Pirellulales bacterium]
MDPKARSSVAPTWAIDRERQSARRSTMVDREQNGAELPRGKSHPLGATVCPDGVGFSVFSKGCTAIELVLFDRVDDAAPARVVNLEPGRNRSYHYWHVFIPGLKAGQLYGFRAAGPCEPACGRRFDGEKSLLDPYGRCVAVPAAYGRAAASRPGDNAATAMKSVVVDSGAYDWEGDVSPRHPFSRTVIYEMHVGGFTRHPSSAVAPEKRGTYAGLIEKIPYLHDLGVTAVELLPVYQFDEQDCPRGGVNYWGYCPVSFFAPHGGYSSRRDVLGPVDEFRDMVKALHRAGIEVILDVVYNHTAEGNHEGPTLSFRGLANSVYYILENDRQYYANYTGTGNTLNANQPIVRRMILDSLRYWVAEMHVDGFRFDLASILSRDESGRPLENPPVLWDIESDPVLAQTKLIAEAWDAAGLYQVGSFVGDSWKEWNGRFRDDVRAFLKADEGAVSRLPARLLGSPDLYGHEEREPEQSINFVTCHDGFTLNDLVSYNGKHNEANGEGNRDGCDNNVSWNCGAEGPTADARIERLRNRQVKNFHAINMLGLGVPMLLMGDEVRRSQLGSNNAYCQNNETSWFDWGLVQKHRDVHRFVKHLVAARATRDASREESGMSLNELLRQTKIHWHGVRLNQPDWRGDSHSLAFTAWSLKGRMVFHVMLNAYWEPLVFELPPVGDGQPRGWRRWFDTYLDSPDDISGWAEAAAVADSNYVVQSHSVAALFALGPEGESL